MATLEEAKRLIAQRDDVDKQIAEQEQILKDNGVDMKTPLVDGEGFPLTNVDIYSVRHARQTLICARNDRQKLTDQIEAMMLELHANARQNVPLARPLAEEEPCAVHRTSNRPFARVDNVLPLSPAEHSGLQDGDHIVQFGSLHAANFANMAQFTNVVQNSIGKKIRVTVLRDGRAQRMELTPQQWSGRGVLGCSVLPLTSSQIV
uniref:26S proteasome non-ATPase regulatory subunit 9 n=1 Tax=Parascaris univalens TaxID=6257 RepID=A0A915AT40_PARUN